MIFTWLFTISEHRTGTWVSPVARLPKESTDFGGAPGTTSCATHRMKGGARPADGYAHYYSAHQLAWPYRGEYAGWNLG
jgi:hypothetical protein